MNGDTKSNDEYLNGIGCGLNTFYGNNASSKLSINNSTYLEGFNYGKTLL
jgi:hypothetical protein